MGDVEWVCGCALWSGMLNVVYEVSSQNLKKMDKGMIINGHIRSFFSEFAIMLYKRWTSACRISRVISLLLYIADANIFAECKNVVQKKKLAISTFSTASWRARQALKYVYPIYMSRLAKTLPYTPKNNITKIQCWDGVEFSYVNTPMSSIPSGIWQSFLQCGFFVLIWVSQPFQWRTWMLFIWCLVIVHSV